MVSNNNINNNDELLAYASYNCLREDKVLKALREETQSIEGAHMQISPEQGQFMAMLVKLINAKNILEIGTFTGYSALVMAMALPDDGKIITCDIDQEPTDIAKKYWREKHLDHKIDLRIAPAIETLEKLKKQGGNNSFDFIFIDADKSNYDLYYEASLVLLRPKGLLLIDNTLWYGRVIDPAYNDSKTKAIRKFNQKLKSDNRIEVNLLPLYDGLSLVYKKY